MSVTVQISKNYRLDSTSFTETRTITANASVRRSESMTRAKTGTISGGTATMEAGHGIITGDKVSAFWTVNGIGKSRRNVTVGTVATNSVPLTGGTGDTLPTSGAVISLMVERIVETRFDADDVQALLANCAGPANVWFSDDANADLGAIMMPNSGQSKDWNIYKGEASPLTAAGVITKVHVAHGDSVTRSVEVGVAFN